VSLVDDQDSMRYIIRRTRTRIAYGWSGAWNEEAHLRVEKARH